MADITMCADAECPHAKNCHRYNAQPGPLQSWFNSSPRQGKFCVEFIEPRHARPEPASE